MRNLKKILALVLALVMVVGMMSIATAATPGTSFTDDADITKFDESIQILEQLGIYKGDTKGNFNYNMPITRAEFSALIYRVVHDEAYVDIYADYNKFVDVDSDAWYAGYVNYCANSEYILGDGKGNFMPNANITGYQVLAVVLRTLGYDREGEFTGIGWEVRTARLAKELGITKNIVEGTLGAPATRAMVAELLYRAIAQTSMVSWNLIYSYTPTNCTLAYVNFGLRGVDAEIVAGSDGYTEEDFEDMTVREGFAPEEDYYGEPIAFWYVTDTDEGLLDALDTADYVTIRPNPVASFYNGVTDGQIFAALTKVGTSYSVDYSYVDGGENDLGLDTVYKNGTELVAGNGAEADVYVAANTAGEPEVYVVVKNTYIDMVYSSYVANTSYFTLLSTDYADVDNPYTTGLAAGSMVLFNMYNDVVDTATLEVAKSKQVTVGSTYDNGTFDDSYFKVGNTKYLYNCNYHIWEETSVYPYYFEILVGDEGDIMNGQVADNESDSHYGLGDTANAFFDKYGNVILLGNVYSAPAAQGVAVVTAADTVKVAKGEYVLDLDIVTTTGAKKSVKAVVADFDDINDEYLGTFAEWDYTIGGVEAITEELMENGAFLTNYFIDAETGYYVLYDYDLIDSLSGDIVRGDANAITDIDVDATTVYIVETYQNDGAKIKGYSVYAGFKKVPTLDELNLNGRYYEAVYTIDYSTTGDVVFVKGAKNGENPETVTVPNLVYVMSEVPEKSLTKDEDGNSITYWTYTVVQNGKVTTLKATTDPDLIEYAGLYEIEKDAEVRGFYELTPVDTQNGELRGEVYSYYSVSGDVLYTEYNNYVDSRYVTGDKLTLADSVKVYTINGTTLTEITLDKLVDGMGIEFLVDKYGYVSTIFVIGAYAELGHFDVTLDQHP